MKAEQIKELDNIFSPRSVAIIGASEQDFFTLALMGTKMKENLYLVNPNYKEVFGKRCYPTILDIEEEIDHAIIAVRASLILKLLDECIGKGVNAAHIFTAGFSETGLEEGRRLENEVKEVAKNRIRLIGPNCMGIHCPKSGLSFVPGASAEEGTVGVISQSGTFADMFIATGDIRNIRFSKVVSYGNGIDLDCPDFLEYLSDDPETEVIALYIEGTRDGKHLKSALAQAARRKPVVALKGGVTEHGSRAASSHTGSLAGSPEIWSSLFKQTGVVQVDNFDELVDAVLALTRSPLPFGKGVSIITSSGGFSVLETDSCVKAGLEVPQFEERTREELKRIVPTAGTSVRNPLDAWPLYYNVSETSGTVSAAIKIVANDKNIHSLLLHLDELKYVRHVWAEAYDDCLKEFINTTISGCQYARDEIGKPVAVCVSLDAFSKDNEDRKDHLAVKKAFESKQFPVFSSLDAAIKALFNLYRYRMKLTKTMLESD